MADGAVHDVVGDIEQTANEGAVALSGIDSGRTQDEGTLGARRHDRSVLDGLRLHQAQHLGAEVLGAVGPAEPTTGDGATAQMHALDGVGVHEDLAIGDNGSGDRQPR